MSTITPGRIDPPPNDYTWDEGGSWKKVKDWMFKTRNAINALLSAWNAQANGTATFAAGVLVTVTIPTQADANYLVLLGPQANKTFWVSNKGTTSFKINASATSSDSVDWLLTR